MRSKLPSDRARYSTFRFGPRSGSKTKPCASAAVWLISQHSRDLDRMPNNNRLICDSRRPSKSLPSPGPARHGRSHDTVAIASSASRSGCSSLGDTPIKSAVVSYHCCRTNDRVSGPSPRRDSRFSTRIGQQRVHSCYKTYAIGTYYFRLSMQKTRQELSVASATRPRPLSVIK